MWTEGNDMPIAVGPVGLAVLIGALALFVYAMRQDEHRAEGHAPPLKRELLTCLVLGWLTALILVHMPVFFPDYEENLDELWYQRWDR
jgi:hypothetical protein